MGRGKIEIEKIENKNARQVTFSKRRAGLFKKAHELAVLCEADVAVIIFSCTGKMFEFSSTDMKTILERYNKCLESKQSPAVQPKPENQKQEPDENEFLKQEIERLKSKQRQLLGKDLIGMDLQELHEVERQLQEGLLCVKTRKEQILLQQIAESKMRGERLMDDNVIWRKQVEHFKLFLPSTNYYLAPHSIDYLPETTRNLGPEDYKDSDTTLLLGPPTSKRKTLDGEKHSKRNENVE